MQKKGKLEKKKTYLLGTRAFGKSVEYNVHGKANTDPGKTAQRKRPGPGKKEKK